MSSLSKRARLLAVGALFVASACGGKGTVPAPLSQQVPMPGARSIVPDDNTSILKRLTKDVEIGSTVDPNNGDTGPRAVSLVKSTFGLKKGQLIVCNFANSAGAAGQGTTIEVLNPKPGSKPATYAQNAKLAGCDGDAITVTNQVYATGLTSGRASHFDPHGNLVKSYGNPVQAPFADADAYCGLPYAPEDVYVSNSQNGAIVKMEFYEVSGAQRIKMTEVIAGFATNKGTGWGILGPSGIQYDSRRTGSLCNDTLYIVDGANNTIVAVSNASNLLVKDEIIVERGGKFKCKNPKATCARLVYGGAPLNAPVASALLPNGNLIVANTKGGNTLVELTPAGKVLATKKIDASKTAHVFGMLAVGTSDRTTALYYTDTATNTLHELRQ